MILFDWVGFYGISIIVGCLMPNFLYILYIFIYLYYIDILGIYDLVWLALWRINYCRFMANPVYTYIIYIIWFGFKVYKPL